MNKKLITIGLFAALACGALGGATAAAAATTAETSFNGAASAGNGGGATKETYLSKEIIADATFTSAAISWDEISPPGTEVKAYLRFKNDSKEGEFSEWLGLDEEVESQQGKITSKYSIASTNSAKGIQYRFEFFGTGSLKPTIKNVKLTFLKTVAAEETSRLLASSSAAAATSKTDLSIGTYIADSSTSAVKIIKRADWGANEKYRYLSDNTVEPELIEVSSDFYEKFKAELKYSKVIEADAQGNKYKWPIQYPEKVKKIIIHHTATTKNLDNPKQAIRDIYYYHAVTHGWGDIGYNYIIDQQGNIYEGRAGGEGVIGAHAGQGNVGSIGIAVLGNYEDNAMPAKVKKALIELIALKAKLHGINPSGRSMFRGKMMDNVFGHGEIMATACPGKNLKNMMRSIRQSASAKVKELNKSTTVKDDKDAKGPDLRVKLGFSKASSGTNTGDPEITGSGKFKVYSKEKLMGEFNANEVVKISFGEKYQLDYLGKTNYSADELRFIPDANTILRINNFNHQPAWNKDLNDNEYRGILEVRKVDKDLVVINELPLEDYLKGLGEAANTDSTEKIKAVIVAARTYAKYYIEKEQKFPGKPYNIDDSPDVSQNYLGYGLEKRAPNVVAAVDVTKGEVVTYKGVIVKTPFFSQTDGTKTKSAKDVWGWTTTPYLVSVDDSSCKATKFLGHGVGLSGCGSQGMALLGFKYQDILKHYYTGVEITDQY